MCYSPFRTGSKDFSQKPVLMTQHPWRVFQQAGGSASQGAPWEVALRWRTWSLRRTSVFSSGLQLSPPARCLTSEPALSVCNGKDPYPMKSKCQRGGELCKVLNDLTYLEFFPWDSNLQVLGIIFSKFLKITLKKIIIIKEWKCFEHTC